MRVVHVVTRSHRRGAEVVALELAEALDALGHHDEVLAMAQAVDGGSTAGLPPLVEATRLGLRTYLLSGWRLRRRLARQPADVVLAHGGSAALLVAAATRRAGAVRVWQRILGLPLTTWGPWRRRLWRIVARRFDAVVALTPELEDEVRQLGFDGPVWVIPNARNPERFVAVDRPAAARDLRARVGVDPTTHLIGFVGHLVEQKQPELAVEVLAELRRRGRTVHLVVVGDGPLRPMVAERIARLGVADAVTLLGHRDDPEAVFGGVDLVLLTSRAEGIPGVAIEAQMTGCPVVSFPVGGVDTVVANGVTGIILPRPDVADMADCVDRLLDDPTGLARMGRRASAGTLEQTMARAADRYAAAFTGLHADRK